MPGVYNRVTELDAVVAGQLGDAMELQASFDLAAPHTVLSHVPDPPGVLAQAFRVLRPGPRRRIGPELSQALKGEARRRTAVHSFPGYIAYTNLTA
jgi:ubiquinone/menaquinone biosynthesis C-methylase UbiE